MPSNPGMVWRKVARTLLVVHAPRFGEGDWQEFIASLDTMSDYSSVLVFANGVRLNATQRAQIQRQLSRSRARCAVLTDSALTRGVVTALSWFSVRIAAFAPKFTGRRAELRGNHAR